MSSKNIGIVLSGGGAKGAFELGALDVILKKIEEDGDKLVSVSGTSIGSFNGAFLAAGQFDFLKETWMSWDNNSPINETFILGPYIGLLLHGYMIPNEPLRNFLTKTLDIEALKKSDIDYLNTRVRIKDGELLFGGNFDRESKPNYEYVNEILASMAFIPARKEVRVKGEYCADGGFRECVPVKPLIDNTKKCDEIYVILVDPKERIWKYGDVSKMNGLERFQWSHMDILWTETVYNDVKLGRTYWEKDDSFHVIQPLLEKMTSSDIGDFDKKSIQSLYNHGVEEAQKMLAT